MKGRIEEAVKVLLAKCVEAAYYDHSVTFADLVGNKIIVLTYDSEEQVIRVIKWQDFESEHIVDFQAGANVLAGVESGTSGLKARLTYFLEGELI